jgi:hypothetical protein
MTMQTALLLVVAIVAWCAVVAVWEVVRPNTRLSRHKRELARLAKRLDDAENDVKIKAITTQPEFIRAGERQLLKQKEQQQCKP